MKMLGHAGPEKSMLPLIFVLNPFGLRSSPEDSNPKVSKIELESCSYFHWYSAVMRQTMRFGKVTPPLYHGCMVETRGISRNTFDRASRRCRVESVIRKNHRKQTDKSHCRTDTI